MRTSVPTKREKELRTYSWLFILLIRLVRTPGCISNCANGNNLQYKEKGDKNNHLKCLIKQAKFSDTEACVEDIEYHADRNLDKTQIARLSTCNFITEHHNLLLLGATGSGKTYIACALGMSAVCSFLPVKYICFVIKHIKIMPS